MRLLIVYPYAFGTVWAGATPRIMQVARGLTELGWQVDLLRCRQANEAALSSVIQAFPGSVSTAPFNGPYPAAFNRKGLRPLFRYWMRSTGALPEGDPAPVLVERLVSFARKDSKLPKPDLVWGITVGFLTGPVVAQRLAEGFRCPYIVEFQDPVPHPGQPALAPELQQSLESCLTHSSLVVTTTCGITSKVEADFPTSRGKVKTFYMSYEETAPAAAIRTAGPLRLLHAGVLYGGSGRNANSLVRAIAEAARQEPGLRGNLRLCLLGGGTGGQEAAGIAKDLGVEWSVEVRPQLPQAECYQEMDLADVLVAIKFDDPQYDLQIPGKIFQYLARGKPILGLMRETEAASILRQSGLGLVRANADIQGIAAGLLELFNHRQALSERFRPNWEFIKSFSVANMARSLDRELSKLPASAGGKTAPRQPITIP
jgi:glycosyltransferase involved in cell wall biosynthesis